MNLNDLRQQVLNESADSTLKSLITTLIDKFSNEKIEIDENAYITLKKLSHFGILNFREFIIPILKIDSSSLHKDALSILSQFMKIIEKNSRLSVFVQKELIEKLKRLNELLEEV